jgi:hypothetical protein
MLSKFLKIDTYTKEVLIQRLSIFKKSYEETEILIKAGLPIRRQNIPDDISENISKFIIINYDNQPSCKWSKLFRKKGDLFSNKYDKDNQIEIKTFSSNGPCSFGSKKKFGIIYFLDMRNWLNNKYILWKVNLHSDAPEWKQLKMNKLETHEDQCLHGRRPHICWDNIYNQLSIHCYKVFEGTFEDIFIY